MVFFEPVLGVEGAVVEGVDAGVELGGVAELDDEESEEDAVLFSPEPLSADAAGLSAFAALSDFPPSDFGAVPLSPFG